MTTASSRALMALATALADCNNKDAEIIVAAMAREHGVGRMRGG
jgi:hypothetical protein